MFKPTTFIEHDDELIYNPDDIADILVARYVEVSSTESDPLDFLSRKEKANLDFQSEVYRTYNCLLYTSRCV